MLLEPAVSDHLLNDVLKDSVNIQITNSAQEVSQKAACQPCGEAGDMTQYFVMIEGREESDKEMKPILVHIRIGWRGRWSRGYPHPQLHRGESVRNEIELLKMQELM